MNKKNTIKFSRTMASALYSGIKTATRRPFKNPIYRMSNDLTPEISVDEVGGIPSAVYFNKGESLQFKLPVEKPAYDVGDIVAVLEPYACVDMSLSAIPDAVIELLPSIIGNEFKSKKCVIYAADYPLIRELNWKAPDDMPLELSRMTVVIKKRYAQVLGNISDKESIAEGLKDKASFLSLWSCFYPESTENEIVWCYEFDVHRCNVGDFQGMKNDSNKRRA